MKTIYIFLTRSGTTLSKLVHFFTADPYTHASISFEDSLQPLYSSSRKNGVSMFPAGPCREYFHKGIYKLRPYVPCAVYELQVPDEVYDRARAEAQNIIEHSDEYHFNVLGLILCRLNIPFQRRGYFFCSQFVSEILHRSGALKLPKDPSLMRPSDYANLPELNCLYTGNIRDLLRQLHPVTNRSLSRKAAFAPNV